jgi:hypothetical protein
MIPLSSMASNSKDLYSLSEYSSTQKFPFPTISVKEGEFMKDLLVVRHCKVGFPSLFL